MKWCGRSGRRAPAEGGHRLNQDGQSETSYVQLKLSFHIKARKMNWLLESEKKLPEHMLTHTGLQVGFSGSAAGFYRAPPRGMQVQMAATHQWQWLLTRNDLTKFVHVPLSTGDLNCQSYLSHTHGGFICLVLYGLYLVVLAVPVNGDLGARNESGLLPGEGNIFSCHIRASNPVYSKISFPISLQTVLAALLGPNNINYL